MGFLKPDSWYTTGIVSCSLQLLRQQPKMYFCNAGTITSSILETDLVEYIIGYLRTEEARFPLKQISSHCTYIDARMRSLNDEKLLENIGIFESFDFTKIANSYCTLISLYCFCDVRFCGAPTKICAIIEYTAKSQICFNEGELLVAVTSSWQKRDNHCMLEMRRHTIPLY